MNITCKPRVAGCPSCAAEPAGEIYVDWVWGDVCDDCVAYWEETAEQELNS